MRRDARNAMSGSRIRSRSLPGQRGSSLVLALFVITIVTGLGIGLLSTSRLETEMSRADLRSKEAFYLAEAAEEAGRLTLFHNNGSGDFSDDLGDTGGAAGPNGAIDFDPTTVQPVYDADGNVTGFTGYGDDIPIAAFSALEGGSYMAFLTNDPAETITTLTDLNDQVMITGIGAGSNRSVEIVQAILERDYVLPLHAPATITLLGPTPTFDGGTSGDKLYSGNDCSDPNLSVPAIGVIGPAAEALAEAGVDKPETFVSGVLTGLDAVEDVDGSVEDDWKDCWYWHDLAQTVKAEADVVGDSTTPISEFGTPGDPKLVYIEGDFDISGNFAGAGILWVTGQITWGGNVGWFGSVYVVGQGIFERDGGGDGVTSGPIVLANIAGPDGEMWTSDDCTGADGTAGTSDDGIDSSSYVNGGGGEHRTGYCEAAAIEANPSLPYKIISFLQR